MELRKALAGVGVLSIRGDPATWVTGVAYDSRRVTPGDLFACVRGERADGHGFAAEALRRGAAALLVEEYLDLPVAQARVASTRRAMAVAAHELWGRPSEKLALIGVTGTNGKTTTTHLVEAMAAAAGRRVALVGTVGARVAGEPHPVERTTPEGPDFHRLLAEMVDKGVEVAAVEVSSHALVLERTSGACFSVAAFTQLTQDHLDFHPDMESYFAAKASLFAPDRCRRGVICVDDGWGRRLADHAEAAGLELWRVSAGAAPDADVVATDVRLRQDGSSFTLRTPEGDTAMELRLAGAFNVANAAVAAAASLAAGLPLAAVGEGAARLRGVPGRFETVTASGPHVVVDYAHTPDGVRCVLAAARELLPSAGRLSVVLGAGGDRDPAKRAPMGEAAGRGADFVVVTNDNPRSEDPASIASSVAAGVAATGTPHEVVLDRRRAIRRALERCGPADILVIAGKGHETGQEIAGVTVPFDDRTVAAEELARRGLGSARDAPVRVGGPAASPRGALTGDDAEGPREAGGPTDAALRAPAETPLRRRGRG